MARAQLALLVVCSLVLALTVAGQRPPKYRKLVRCNSRHLYRNCKGFMYCPARCPRSCYVDCATCKAMCLCNAPGAVCGDPRFIGGDGITFYFHGRKNQDFCLFSDSGLHINAHFIGKRDPTMTRDFTWVQAIALPLDDHRLYVGAQKTAAWDDAVDRLMITFDGERVQIPTKEGAKWQPSSARAVSIVRTSTANAVTVEVEGKLKITLNAVPITEEESRVHSYGVTKDDCIAHLELGFKFYSLSSDVHGVLGQTYREDYVSRVDVTKKMPVMGGADKFFVSDMFSADCAVSRFGREAGGIAMAVEHEDVKCSSGMGGRGIVCKK
ncbi:unnamed protein product [Musa hybrid cultivar]